ncbi:MAG: TraR/DksA C4-type zinc finger protein [Desulfobacterales bacterium]|nr:TraR/DksA C4-type zinc finger protein [Desulfobacterales bacterium]
MDNKEKETIKQAILSKIRDLEEKVESLTELSKPVTPDNAIGRLTRMEAINSRSINEASLSASRQTLNNLKKALGLIDDPDFGYCLHCEEPIPYKRLMIMPETSLCVACAEKINSSLT